MAIVWLVVGMAAGVYVTTNLYMGTYFWEFSSDQLALLMVPTLLGTLIAFAALNHLGRRYDKPQLMCAAAVALALNSAWMIGARLRLWRDFRRDGEIGDDGSQCFGSWTWPYGVGCGSGDNGRGAGDDGLEPQSGKN